MPRLLFVALLLVSWLAPWAHASETVQIERVQVNLDPDEGWLLSADSTFDLNPQLRNVAERGLSLYLTADLQIAEPRWWWLDRQVLEVERVWSISYNALIRQWRVSLGSLALPVHSLDDAMDMVRRFRDWRFANPGALSPDGQYRGRLRLRLDVSQLARPFQVNAMNSSAWSLATPWHEFRIEPQTLGVWQP